MKNLLVARNILVRRALRSLAFMLLSLAGAGCAAMSNPIGDGVPVRRLPPELLEPSKNNEETIPLTLLGQPPADSYRFGPEDVIGLWIEGILGEKNIPFPLNVPTQTLDNRRFPPGAGYPVTVQKDGTISLPFIEPLMVNGLDIGETERLIRKAYLDAKILAPGKDRILVTLMTPRQFHVIVMRQEGASFTPGPQGVVPTGKRGTGTIVHLYANENDVLHALAQSGGLPSLDVLNEVIIFKRVFEGNGDNPLLLNHVQNLKCRDHGYQKIVIPLRANPGAEQPPAPQDIILNSGDVVFLEARDQDVFYTGGLLPATEQILPRDRDLDVVQAVSLVRGPILNGAFGTNSLSGNLINPGIGLPSPSLLTVVRKTPGGGQILIRVDLNRALRDPRERIVVRAGDMLYLQEKPSEAMTRWTTQTMLNFNLVWRAIKTSTATGVFDISAPDRLPGRLAVQQFLD